MISSSALAKSSPNAACPCRAGTPRRRSGFTLVEILVVLAIIGLLVGLAVTNLGKVFGGAQISAARLFVNDSMKTALTTYRIQMGNYPSTDDGLQALITPPADQTDRWQGPYIEVQGGKLPLDPWQRPYHYRFPGTHNKDGYDLWSTGPSGVDGGDDNIGNW
jgi:general secretion pathway protein G